MLVGGQGTRLRPLTVSTPKPMLPAAGVPFVAHQFARARAAGVDHIVLATSYRAEVFEDYFGTGSDWGLDLDYVTETEPLGTGGGIRNVADRLKAAPDDPVLVLNGDILSGHDIAGQLDCHRGHDADVTLHLTSVGDARPFGCVPTDQLDRVTAFLEKTPDPVSNQINAGCYVFRRRIIDAIPAGRSVSVERETFPGLLDSGARVFGYLAAGYWRDLGTPEAFRAGCCDLASGLVGSPAVERPGESVVAADADVAADARLCRGTVVESGAVVGPGAELVASVVFPGARVGAGARVCRSILGCGAVVGDGVVVEDAVIGDRAMVAEGNELRAGIRLWPDLVLPPHSVRFSGD